MRSAGNGMIQNDEMLFKCNERCGGRVVEVRYDE